MRRAVTLAAMLFVAALPVTACANNPEPGTDASASPSAGTTATVSIPPASGPGVPGGADNAAVCAAYQAAQDQAQQKFIELLPRAAEATNDPSKAPAVLAELKTALKAYETAIAAEAGRAADGQLKAALEADLATLRATATSIEAAGTDMDKVLTALNSPDFQNLGENVKAICEPK